MASPLYASVAKRSIARRLLDLVFGFDFFISYAWADGGHYARDLAHRLSSLGYEVFLDRSGFSAGDDWTAVGSWALRRTGLLILVATPDALASGPVESELRIFTETGRRVIPVDIAEAMERAPDSAVSKMIPRELLRIREAHSALEAGPTAEAVAAIHRTFDLVRQDKKRLRAFMAIAMTLAALAIASGVGAILATRNAKLASTRRDDALTSQSLFLADEATRKVNEGDAGTALRLASDALPNGDPVCPIDRPYLPEAELALNGAIHALRETRVLRHEAIAATSHSGMIEPGATAHVYHAEFDPTGRTVLTTADDGALRLWDIADGKPTELHSTDPHSFFSDAQFSRDGTRLAAGGTDGTLWVWDLKDRDHPRVQSRSAHTKAIQHVAFSPDGKTIATASSDTRVLVWRSDDLAGLPICELTEHKDAVYRLAFDPTGTRIVTASRDGVPRVLDVRTCKTLALVGHADGAVFQAEFSPDGELIATASEGGTVGIWLASDGSWLRGLSGHTAGVSRVVFDRTGRLLATASRDGTARLWSRQDQRIDLLAILKGHTDRLYHVAFDRSSERVVTVSGDGTARLWTVPSRIDGGSSTAMMTGDLTISPSAVLAGHTAMVSYVDFSPDGRLVITASHDGTARIWSTAPRFVQRLHSSDGPITAAAEDLDRHVVLLASDVGTVLLFDASDGRLLHQSDGRGVRIGAAAMNRSGTLAVTGADDGSVVLWDVPSGTPIADMQGHTDAITSVEFGGDGRTIITASLDGTARLWDAKGHNLRVLAGHGGWVWRARFDASGRFAATSSIDGTARVWDVGTGLGVSLLRSGPGSVDDVAFSPDGRLIATGHADGIARLWSYDGTLVRELKGHEPGRAIRSMAFSPDGTLLATASDDTTVRIWKVSDGAPATVLVGHDAEVLRVAFHDDGARVATMSLDGTSRVWDVHSARQIASVPVRTASTPFVAFSRDDKLLTLSGRDASLVPLFGSAEDAMTFARSVAPRDLSDKERQDLFLLPKGAEGCRG